MDLWRNKIHFALGKAFAAAALFSQTAIADPAPARPIIPPADTVTDVQNLLDANLKSRPHALYDRYIVIDTDKIDKEMVAGQSGENAVAAFFAAHGYANPDPVKSLVFAALTEHVHQSPLGNVVITAWAAADDIPAARLCVVVPASGGLLEEGMKGLLGAIGITRTVEFVNRHETWHCLDDTPPYRNYRHEAFSDAGAVGDMIRGGAGLDLLDAVAGWRQDRAWDLVHWSTPVLKAMKAEIEHMGLDRFRAMDDAAAEKFYHRIADNNGLSPPDAMNAFVMYRLLHTEEYRQKLLQNAKTNPGIAQGLALADEHAGLRQEATVILPARTLIERLARWDAPGLLRAKAREMTNAETPAALTVAYDALRDDLRGKMAAQPFNLFYVEQVLSLRTAFVLTSATAPPVPKVLAPDTIILPPSLKAP